MDIDPQEPQVNQNGTNGTEERSPTPPPHKSSGSTDEADSFKLAGNKFFKDGDYRRAIEEYNKGMLLSSNLSLSVAFLCRHLNSQAHVG
jgi:DnaJ family protein C protein 7